MVNEGDYVAVFNSIHRVMKAEKLLKERGIAILLIPAPRDISADCGLAIRYAAPDRPTVEGVLAEVGLTPELVYLRQNGMYVKVGAGEI